MDKQKLASIIDAAGGLTDPSHREEQLNAIAGQVVRDFS